MKRAMSVLVLVCSESAAFAQDAEPPEVTIHVNCDEAPGGDGGKKTPYPSITAALPAARAASASASVDIVVAESTCDDETLPILLDFPVRLRGARIPDVDSEGLPTGGQEHDTLVTVAAASTTATFFRITADDVHITNLSVDGKLRVDVDGRIGETPKVPLGVRAAGAYGYVLRDLRLVGLGQTIRSDASSGHVTDSYLQGLDGMFLNGGDASNPPTVSVSDSRIVYRGNAISIGASAGFGTVLVVNLRDNEVTTPYTNTSPTGPAGLRISPAVGPAGQGAPGTLTLRAEGNRFLGGKNGIIVHQAMIRASPTGRDDGVVVARFDDNVIGDTVAVPFLVTFTNARAAVIPCELKPGCPTLNSQPPWDYLEGGLYDLRHSGEMDEVLIDHPALQPVTGDALNNTLIINDEVVDPETFVVVP